MQITQAGHTVRQAGAEHRAAGVALLALLVGFLLAGCGGAGSPSDGGSSGGGSTASGTEVTIAGFAFSPATLIVAVGDTVTWTNTDTAVHTVTADDGSFDSGSLGTGGTFTHTFDTAGSYAYHCTIHPGMTATIVVR